MEQKIILDQQKEQFIKKHVERFREDRLEGEIIKKQTELSILKEKREAEKIRRTNMELVKQMRETNKTIKLSKLRELEREKQEDLKIKEYARQKEETLRLRKKEQRKAHDQKQKMKQNMIDTLVKQLEDIAQKENLKLQKDLVEIQHKREDLQKIKDLQKKK